MPCMDNPCVFFSVLQYFKERIILAVHGAKQHMTYQWEPCLATGHTEIDNQHKQLITAVNNLLAACHTGTEKSELERTIDFLLGYTIKHFIDEEKLQKQYNYPDYGRHRILHEEFKSVAANLAECLRKEGPTSDLVVDVYSSLGNWLVNHIKGDDFRMAAFIKTQVSTNSPVPEEFSPEEPV